MFIQRIFLLILFPFSATFAQNVEKDFIVKLPDTSANQLFQADMHFGPGDIFSCLYHTDSPMLITNSKAFEPFLKEEHLRPIGTVLYNVSKKNQYFNNRYNAQVVGPYDGKIETAISNGNYMAYTVSLNDSVSYYVNGTKVATVDSFGYISRTYTFMNIWCVFSSNGNTIYTIKNGLWNYLFVNGNQVDSSKNYYSMLDIDDRGNYNYSLGQFERNWFKPIAHKPQRVVYRHEVWSNSSIWVYAADDTIHYYGNINGKNYLDISPFEKLVSSDEIIMLTKENTTFGFTLSNGQKNRNRFLKFPISKSYHPESASKRAFINGIGHDLPYEEIILPCIDSLGNYALFGLRDYYLYKNINGVEEIEPLSKHKVRAKPISIDVIGNTICYYQTDDSVYIYENDRLFKSCTLHEFELHFDSRIWHNTGLDNKSLPVINIDNCSYVIYKTNISPPLLRMSYKRNSPIGANINKYGYWLIQKMSSGKYVLIINNKIVPLPKGTNFDEAISYKLSPSFRLTANEFIYYKMEGDNIYRYKLKL